MEFVKTASRGKAETALFKRLQKELQAKKQVLWLLSGGSNIAISAAVMERIPRELTPHLAIFLMDERFGDVGHIDSNDKQLQNAGFHAKEAIFVSTLQPGFSMEETRERFEEASKRAFEHADVVIGQVGIGTDGHIAGILPHSSAAVAGGWTAAYDTVPFRRITLTFDALRQVDVMYAFAFGEEKQPTLLRLRDEDLPLDEQPAQLLKELPESYIYNDQIGGKT